MSGSRTIDFSRALLAMKDGHRVQRAVWKGEWVCLGNGGIISWEEFWNEHTRIFASGQTNHEAELLPYFIMKTADDKIQMGWHPSQSDILAEDWQVVA